jgi:RimJ/RimL family protein N-acetyltransferase
MYRLLKGLFIRLRKDGLRGTTTGLVHAVRRRRWRVYRFYPPIPDRDESLDIDTDMSRLARLRRDNDAIPGEYYRDVAGRCNRCCYTCVDGKLAGIAWMLDSRSPSRFIHLGPAEVEIAFVHVMPAFRGRGIAKAMVNKACQIAFSDRVSTIYSIIEETNTPSQHAFTACHFKQIGVLHRTALFGNSYVTPASDSDDSAKL